MSPAILAADRRPAALRSTAGSAPRTAVITAQEGNVERRTPRRVKVRGNVTSNNTKIPPLPANSKRYRMSSMRRRGRCGNCASPACSFARLSTRTARSSAGSNPNCRHGSCQSEIRTKDGHERRITASRRLPRRRQRVTMPREMTSLHREHLEIWKTWIGPVVSCF